MGIRVLERLGLTERIPIASLAKSFEEVYLPGQDEPLRLPRQSEALYLLQRLRDEAHRFAISYHRKLRGKRMTAGALDGIPGLGPKRRARLIEHSGASAGLREPPARSCSASRGCLTRWPTRSIGGSTSR